MKNLTMRSFSKILIFIWLNLASWHSLWSINAENLTYEKLADNPWTDHVCIFKLLFELEKINSLLSFDMGIDTKYFLAHCTRVTSIELGIRHLYEQNLKNYYDALDLFEGYHNWNPKFYFFSDVVSQADLAAREFVNPRFVFPKYQEELERFIQNIFQKTSYDVAFVNSPFVLRSDIINLLFGHVDIIIAHDTNTLHPYAWHRIPPNAEYEKIVSLSGEGTTIWIHIRKKELLQKLKVQIEAL